MKAPIVEIFETIQGEGKTIGKPSIFVRFWGCNLRCQFATNECDTPYAVFKERKNAPFMTAEDVAAQIKKLKPKHIVWTGGEPMLFQNFICEVHENLGGKYTSEIETNGTQIVKPLTVLYIDQFNMSVKLKSSNQANDELDKMRINHDAISSYPINKSYFKFVCSGKEDLKEIYQITKHHPEYDVWLMPEGFRRKQVIEHSEEVVNLCIENGWHFSPREHIIIWDYKRGV